MDVHYLQDLGKYEGCFACGVKIPGHVQQQNAIFGRYVQNQKTVTFSNRIEPFVVLLTSNDMSPLCILTTEKLIANSTPKMFYKKFKSTRYS